MSPHAPHSSEHSVASALALAAAPLRGERAPLTLDSATLLSGTREVVIRHGAEIYRLRRTRNDKLILTK